MLRPTVSHIAWNVVVEPVKWIPARSGEASAGSPTSAPAPGTRLVTPGGRPAASRIPMMQWAAYTAVQAGCQTPGSPLIAAAAGRMPPTEDKLNGVTPPADPRARPLAGRRQRSIDRAPDVGGARLVPAGEHMAMVVRHHGVGGRPGRHSVTADEGRDLDDLARHLRELGSQGLALGAAGGVGEDGLVTGGRHGDDRVRHLVLLALVSLGRAAPQCCLWAGAARGGFRLFRYATRSTSSCTVIESLKDGILPFSTAFLGFTIDSAKYSASCSGTIADSSGPTFSVSAVDGNVSPFTSWHL